MPRATRTVSVTLCLSAVLLSTVLLSACGSSAPGATAAVFSPVHRAGGAALASDAAVLTERLRLLGDGADTASVRGGEVMVSGPRLATPAAALGATGAFLARPVLCGAPAYSPPSGGAFIPAGPLPTCQARFATTVANLAITPETTAANGYRSSSVAPDPIFAHYRSSTVDDPARSVLLSADPARGQQQYPRFVLGPAVPGAFDVASASALFDAQIDAWAVSYTLTPSGARAWDEVTRAGFHRFVAIDLDGLVESAPIIEPTQSSFTSFEGRGEIVGNLDRSSARAMAALLRAGPLAAPLRSTGRP